MAHNHESSSNSGLLAELSISFHDELTASIQSAFGVAGELAVVEVSKLVGKAFREVRDQLHKTLVANRSLQTRLSLVQTELRAVQSRALEETRHTRDIAVNTSPIPSEPRVGSSVHARETRVPGDPYARGTNSSFDMQQDGIECIQDVKPDLSEHCLHPGLHPPHHSEDIKEDHHAMQGNASHCNQACTGAAVAPSPSAIQITGCMSFQSGRAAKLEEADQCAHAESNNEQVFSSDSLSVAQSKLLEDWRPEPLQLQSCQSNSYASSGSAALVASPPLFQGDLPSMDYLASTSSSQQEPRQAPHPRQDSLSNPTPNSHFPTHSSVQAHTLDAAFSLPEDVRRYHSVLLPKPASPQQKCPRRSLYPPGRSPFRCSQCSRDFNRMEHLKIHQRIHTGEKPYACTECTARFRHSWALTRHFRIHTGEKPYLCTQCGKSFRNCGGLRFHQKTHARRSGVTNARPILEGYGRA